MHKGKTFDILLTFIICAFIAVLVVFSADAKQGAKDGIGICEGIIIPSLLPILILCKWLISSRLANVFERLFGTAFEKALALPKESAPAVILGLISGYPAGALLTCSLYENRLIDRSAAERIMTFNFCGGCAFIITAVGSVTFGSTKEGVIFYLCNVISSLIIALFTRGRGHIAVNKIKKQPQALSLTDAFCNSVEDTVKALAVMCAYIIFFSVVSRLMSPPDFLVPLLEITNGICTESTPPPQYTVFFLAFGGICIHLQLLPFLARMKVRYTRFLIGRMSGALISFALYMIYSELFPESASVFSNITSPARSFSSGGLALSTVMIIGCAVVIFDIENRKMKLHL